MLLENRGGSVLWREAVKGSSGVWNADSMSAQMAHSKEMLWYNAAVPNVSEPICATFNTLLLLSALSLPVSICEDIPVVFRHIC